MEYQIGIKEILNMRALKEEGIFANEVWISFDLKLRTNLLADFVTIVGCGKGFLDPLSPQQTFYYSRYICLL